MWGIIQKQGRKRPLDTPKRMIERRRDIEREGEIREIEKERGERDREVKGIERVKIVKSSKPRNKAQTNVYYTKLSLENITQNYR